METDPLVTQFFVLLIVVQCLLLLLAPLWRKGIKSFIIGLYISIPISSKERLEPKNLPDTFIYLSFTLIFLTLPMLFTLKYQMIFGEAVRLIMKFFAVEKIDLVFLGRIYLYLWSASIIIGMPHEYLHYYFAKLCGVRMKSLGVVTIMGFPVVFFVMSEKKLKDKRINLLILSGGLISNAILLGIALIVFTLWKNEFTAFFLFSAVLVYIFNIVPPYGIMHIDGVQFLIKFRSYISELKSLGLLRKILATISLLYLIGLIIATYYLIFIGGLMAM